MAGVYIKGMKMPKDCNKCPFWQFDAEECKFCGITPDCPLVGVPDHGDLIDRDEMRKEMTVFCNRRVEDAAMTGNREIRVDWNDALDFIKNASVVIPAERSGDV